MTKNHPTGRLFASAKNQPSFRPSPAFIISALVLF